MSLVPYKIHSSGLDTFFLMTKPKLWSINGKFSPLTALGLYGNLSCLVLRENQYCHGNDKQNPLK